MRRMAKLFASLLLLITVAVPSFAQPAGSAVAHPLDPLSRAEIQRAVTILRSQRPVPADALFPLVALKEPPKAEVLAYTAGTSFRREAALVVLDRAGGRTWEAVVDLRAGSVASMTERPGVQPAITVVEFDEVPEIVRANPEWQAAIRKRGITDFSKVMVDPWAPGVLDPQRESPSVRWVRALAYMKDVNKNGYARPIEGVVAVVNMKTRQVDRVIDTGVHPIPPEIGDLDERAIGRQRIAPKALIQTQPDGVSFTVRGQEVRWQKWRFRFQVHPREGLVLHTVGYEDGGRVRSVLYRASLSEMLVPYADPAENWYFRNAFDEGEYGVGRLTDSLEIGTDAPAHARFFSATFSDDKGVPFTTPRAVALYERDGGVLWKHFEYYNNKTDSRRGRELVLSSIVTVGNYDYGFNWIFRQDGSLELQGVLTGIMLAKGVKIKTLDEHHDGTENWHLVAPYVAAPHHQHFFNFRLDLDVDGASGNRVTELNVNAVPPGPGNPLRNAFVMDETTLATERAAQRDLNIASNRRWGVFNPSRKNVLGQPAGYLLVPGDNSVPYLDRESPVRQRAGFINHHFWATAYAPDEMHAAGEYPNQSVPGEGLPKWTAADRRLDGEDVVVWYTFAPTHIPRPEEWPVMSATTVGFKLIPVGFFSKNPALDVPKPVSAPVPAKKVSE
jgi:primary-amine oxidase